MSIIIMSSLNIPNQRIKISSMTEYEKVKHYREHKDAIKCDIGDCCIKEKPSNMFDHFNIQCITCKMFYCSECSALNWKNTKTLQDNLGKGNLDFLEQGGMTHEIFQCGGCNDIFDRIVPLNKNN